MVYIVANIKGGSGKSKYAGHLLPEHIRRKGKQEIVKIYEFDEHSRSSENYLGNSDFVESEIIAKKDIEHKIFDVKYDSDKEDVIVDVGAGEILSEIIKVAHIGIGLERLVFVVPYSNDGTLALKQTVDLIESGIDNPKIMIVLNRVVFSGKTLEDAKDEVIDLYGSPIYFIKPSPILKQVSKYIKAAIPDISKEIVFAALEKKSFTDIKDRYDRTKDLPQDELNILWKARGLIKGDSPTKEEHRLGYGMLLRESKISDFLESNCEEFFSELQKVEK